MDTFASLTFGQQAALVVSGLFASFLVLDTAAYMAIANLDPDVRGGFRAFTDLGKAGWVLIATGLPALTFAAIARRQAPLRVRMAYAHAANMLGFMFACVAGSGLAVIIAKNVIGRARPKLFHQVGTIDFAPLSFDPDYASFPSGHATAIMAFAAAIAMFFPRARVWAFIIAGWVVASRYVVGAHYLTDILAGAAFGAWFACWLRGRFAARRWVFDATGDGRPPRLRGERVLGLLMGQARTHSRKLGRAAGRRVARASTHARRLTQRDRESARPTETDPSN